MLTKACFNTVFGQQCSYMTSGISVLARQTKICL
uniref:Uncharacterized protein n=1 Tax=Anguilla anguilla TaxID=7936 RepID=A0A0E9T4V3_ANGAN